MAPRQFSWSEVAKHKHQNDCWIVIRGKVYDVTKFLYDHPGGADVIKDVAGTDATAAYDETNHSDEATAMLKDYEIGDIEGQSAKL